MKDQRMWNKPGQRDS